MNQPRPCPTCNEDSLFLFRTITVVEEASNPWDNDPFGHTSLGDTDDSGSVSFGCSRCHWTAEADECLEHGWFWLPEGCPECSVVSVSGG